MGAQTEVDHGKAGQHLVWNGGEDSRDAQVGGDVVQNRVQPCPIEELDYRVVLKIEAWEHLEAVRPVFSVSRADHAPAGPGKQRCSYPSHRPAVPPNPFPASL